MASLTGQSIKDTYQSLLKTDDNGLLTSAFKGITDGSGSASGLYLRNTGVLLSGSVVISGSLLYSGSTINATVTSASYALTASYALNGESTDTGSLLVTASATDNVITFTKGDSTTFTVTIDTGSAVIIDTDSLITTASVSNNTITFTKGDATTFDITVDTGSAATTDTGSLLVTASVSSNTITFTKGDSTTFDITVDTGSATPIDTGSFATTGSNEFTGDQMINGENLGFIIDASNLKRVGFMKYGGLEGSIARVADQNFRILRTTGSNINDGTNAITDFYIAGDGKIGIGTTTPAYTLDVSGSSNFIGNQIIAGNVTFPSGSFISTTDESGSLSFSALNGGTLYLNSDGGEGDVLVGYDGWDGKLKVRGEVEITGSIYLGSGSIISESGSNLVLTPPTALPGQGLVIRPTSGNMILSASGFIVAGETLTITLTSSQFSAASQEDFYYLISGSTAQELGLPSLTGSFLQANWIDAGGNTGYNETAIPIPGNSNATTLTLTITGSSMFFGGYSFTNNPITVTNNGIINNELSHIHLVTSDPAITDLYLGDDDQYVKIEKNAGDVVIGTNNNTHHWTFDTSGSLTVPGDITGAGNLATTGSNEFNGNQGITGSLEQGSGVVASGSYSHAEGNITQAIGDYSHAEGDNTQAIGNYSHAEGQEVISVGNYSHAEGYDTRAIGNYSHAEGAGTKTGTQNAYYAESVVNGVVTLSGSYGDISGEFAAENRLYLYDQPFDDNYTREIFIISQSYYSGSTSNTIVELYNTSINTSIAYVGDLGQGINNWTGEQTIPGDYSHVEGYSTQAIGNWSHAEGASSQAIGIRSHAEGADTQTIGDESHAEGGGTKAIGNWSHAEGNITQAIGEYSHAEGDNTRAIGNYSHAEGQEAISSGSYSHAEGYDTRAIGNYSHAEGYQTIASGSYSHTEGTTTQAIGEYSHAEGDSTQAIGNYSHAEGNYTIASGSYQHVSGQFNQHNNDTSYFVVGIGLTEETRKDGFTVDVDANGSGSVMIPNNLNTPSVAKTGSMYVDPANNKLWIYTGNGGVGGWVTSSLG
jgi:hypothetical protein